MTHAEIVGMGVLVRDLTVVLDRRPGPDEKVTAREFHESGGGPVPTALVILSRLGHSVAMAGWVGDDRSGRLLVDDLAREGVDSSFVDALPELTSPVSVITVEGPHRSICEVGQGGAHPPGALDPKLVTLLEGCRFLLVDGRYPASQIAASRIVRSHGGRVVLDAGRPRPRIDEVLSVVDVAIVSHSYMKAVAWGAGGVAPFLRSLRERVAGDGAGIVGVTLGAEGCALWEGIGELHRIAGHRVEVRDSTGAGDVFHGAFIHALAAGEEIEAAGRFANAAAAMACLGVTGRASLPSEAEIRRFAAR